MPRQQRLQYQSPLDEPRYALVARGGASSMDCCQVGALSACRLPVDPMPPLVASEQTTTTTITTFGFVYPAYFPRIIPGLVYAPKQNLQPMLHNTLMDAVPVTHQVSIN